MDEAIAIVDSTHSSVDCIARTLQMPLANGKDSRMKSARKRPSCFGSLSATQAGSLSTPALRHAAAARPNFADPGSSSAPLRPASCQWPTRPAAARRASSRGRVVPCRSHSLRHSGYVRWQLDTVTYSQW